MESFCTENSELNLIAKDQLKEIRKTSFENLMVYLGRELE